MATNTENIAGIVQHRRGTTEAWKSSAIVPFEGEFIIEECIDGSRRVKVGDGINTFEYLSYVDAATAARVVALEAQAEVTNASIKAINTNVANLKREVTGVRSAMQSIIDPSIEKLDALYTARLNEIEAQHNADITELRSDLAESAGVLVKNFENSLEAHSEESTAQIEDRVSAASVELSNRLSNEVSNLKADLQKRVVNLGTEQAEAIDVINSKLNSTNSTLADSTNKLAAAELQINGLIEEVTKLKELGYGDIVTSEMIGQLRAVEAKVEQLSVSDINVSTQLYAAQSKIATVTRQLNELKAKHTTDYDNVKDSVTSLRSELTASDTEMLAKINIELAKLWAEITDLVDDDIVLYESFAVTRNKLNSKVRDLEAAINANNAVIKKDLTDIISSKETVLKDLLAAEVANTAAALEGVKTELIDRLNTVKDTSDGTDKAIADSVAVLRDDVISKHNTVINELTETKTALEQHRTASEASFTGVDSRITGIDKKLIEVDTRLIEDKERLDSQEKQIGQLVRLEDGSTTGDAELANARIGFDGKERVSVGAYIRELEGDLKQHVNIDAVSGLHYDTDGEVGLKTPYMLYMKNAEGEILQETGVQIISGAGGVGGGGSSTSSLKIEYITTSPVIVTKTDKAIIRFNFSGVDSSGDEILQANAAWKINGETRKYGTVEAGENEFDATEYLKIGTTKVFLTVTDDNGRTVTKSWNVQQLDLSVTSNFNDKLSYAAGKDIVFTYTPYGAVDKTAIFVLDDTKELARIELLAGVSGTEQKFTIPAQPHGAHRLEVYLEADIAGRPEPVPSEPVVKDILWYDPNSNLPIIGSATKTFYAKQYETTNIVYTVYDPTTETPEVTIKVDGAEVATNTVSANPDYDNTPTAVYSFVTDTVGTHTITIICRGVEKVFTAVIDELGINAAPITDGLAFDFNPVGRSNGSDNRLWSYGTGDQKVSLSVSNNFDWTNGGYRPDDPDGPCFCIKAGSSATIDYKLFADDAKKYGKEFKLVFKTKNVANPEAVFLSCIDSSTNRDHIGIEMGVHKANIYGQSGNLELAYSEEDLIEFEFNIAKSNEAVPMVMGYEDGVPSRPMVYDNTFNFTQNTKQVITLGSPDCDLYIYRFKVYNTSLSAEEILHNFIADARTTDEMISRWNRNQIYDSNKKLDPDVFAKNCPWLRVYKLSAPHFTNNKSDKVPDTTIQQLFKDGDPLLDNWICYNAQHSGQGTSSNNYGAAGRNLDFIMNKSNTYFVLGEGNEAVKEEDKQRTDKITLTRTSVPTNYLNAKVNIASSNNLTNAILANRYNKFNPYRRPFVPREGLDSDFIKDTMEFHNCVIFIRETDPDLTTHREFADTDWHFYAIGNIGDSKKTDETRKTDINDEYECCVEIMDVELPLSDFPVDTMMDAMGYEEDDKTHQRIYRWAKDENLDILYEAQFALTEDTEVNLGKVYYIDLPEIVPATVEQQTVENLENLYERKYVPTEDLEPVKNKVYYADTTGTLVTKDELQDIENPKEAGLYEWRREYQKTNDIEIIQDKFYYVSVLKKTNAMAYTYEEVKNYLWAKDENLDNLYELVDGEYQKTIDEKVDLNKTYYYAVEVLDSDENVTDIEYHNAMGYFTEMKKVYTYATTENLSSLYEVTYYPTEDTAVDLAKTYYVDILEHDDFSEDFTYGWRYISDEDDPAIVSTCKQAWIDFYRFVTQSTDEEFKANFEDYFVKDSALYYYLFTTRYCMVDNRAKNTFWHFSKTGKYHEVRRPNEKLLPTYCELVEGKYVQTQDTELDTAKTYYSQYAFDLCWDYDNDTSLGLNNYGKQVYRYGLEDTDLDDTGREIFREMDSLFFCRVRDCFANDLQTMYQTLESSGAWHAESFIAECDRWQSEFPEELWRLDIIRKYIRTYTTSFINGKGEAQFLTNMANGKMKYHRRQWERSQEQYMASKYQTSTAANENSVFRCEVPNGNLVVQPNYKLKLTPYAYMYLNVKYGTGSPIKVRATKLNEPVEIPFTTDRTDIISVYNASLIQDFGDLSACYPQTADTSRASRIRKLTIGNKTEGYTNDGFDTLTTGANQLLEELNIENVTGLAQSLDLQDLINLKKLYAFGTNIPSVLFANGGKLEYVELPAVNNITLKNLRNLASKDFKLADYAYVKDLVIEGCPLVNGTDLLSKCKNLQRVRLTSIDLGSVTYTAFAEKMFKLKGLTANEEETEDAWLEGSVHFTDELLTGAQYNEVASRYPNLKITYKKLASQLRFMQVDGTTEYTDARQTIYDGSAGTDPVDTIIQKPSKESNEEFDYEFVGWSTTKNLLIGENQSYDKEALNSLAFGKVEGDRVLFPVFKVTRRSYEVVFINPYFEGSLEGEELQRVMIPYGSSVTYTGVVPEKLDAAASKDLYEHIGWCDASGNIHEYVTSDLRLYAQFAVDDDDWYTMLVSEIQNGYTLDKVNNTVAIFKYNNPYNKAVKVPESFNIEGTTYNVAGVGGFLGNTKLELISLPDSVTEITHTNNTQQGAFEGCSNLAEIALPPALRKIGNKAFFGCKSLSEVFIPVDVYSIGQAAFAECSKLTLISVDANNKYYIVVDNCLIEKYSNTLVQALTDETNASIPETIKNLGPYCFAGQPLTSINIPEGIQVVSSNAFSGCNKLVAVQLPSSMNVLDATCFSGCSRLANINLPEGLTTLKTYIFNKCALEDVEIPSTVTSLGDHSFGNIASLKSVTFKKQLKVDGSIFVPQISKVVEANSSYTNYNVGAFQDSGSVNDPIVFNLPWSEQQHIEAFGSATEKWGAKAAILNFNYVEE